MSGGCPKTFTEDEIRLYVHKEIFYKYKKFKFSQILLNNVDKNYINCPTPDCAEILEYDIMEEENFLKCNAGHPFCAKCKTVGWHKKGKCNDV